MYIYLKELYRNKEVVRLTSYLLFNYPIRRKTVSLVKVSGVYPQDTNSKVEFVTTIEKLIFIRNGRKLSWN